MGTIYRAVGGDEYVKISVIEGRDIVEQARQIHRLSPTACAVLGRTLCAAAMMGDMMKEDKASVTVRIEGGGPIGCVVAVSDSGGNVRGYVDHPGCELPLRADGKLDVGGAVGTNGLLVVSRDIGLREPYIGSTQLVTGEIGDDFTRYFAESEQVPSAVGLGVLVDTDCTIRAAGGFIVQLMPGAPDGLIEKLENNIFYMDALTTILAEDGPEAVLEQVMKGLDAHLVEQHAALWRCPCSRERVAAALESIGAEALGEMAEDGKGADVDCQFCGAQYAFDTEELRQMARRAKAAAKDADKAQ